MLPKNIKKLNKKLLLGVVLFSASVLFYRQQALALTLSPPRLEISGDPGQTLVGELELYNEQDQQVTFYVSAQNFEARGETGSPYFLPYNGTGLASWIFSENSIVIGPKERVKFPYEVVIPQDSQAGGYFAAIFFATNPATPEEGGQVTIGSKIGTLVFLNISGESPEGAGIIEFKSKDGNIFSYLPVTLFYRFSNDGGRKIMPLGTVEIKNMLGNTAANLDANISKGNILPGSVRKFEITWDKLGQDNVSSKEERDTKDLMVLEEGQKIGFFEAVKMQKENFAFGKYTANLNLKYGDNKTDSKQATFWIIPWQILSLVIGALVILVIIMKVTMKRHNKKLIEQVKKETLLAQQTAVAPTNTIVSEKKEGAKDETEKTEEIPSEGKPGALNPKE